MSKKLRCPSFTRLCGLLIFGTLLTGCVSGSADKEPEIVGRTGEFAVTVTSGGKELRDFSAPLVHRVSLNKQTVDEILKFWPKRLDLPFDGTAERDNRGKVMGLRITAVKPKRNINALGLRRGDLLTAAETKLIATPRDFIQVFDALKQSGLGTVTLEREGKPHKILYYNSES